MPSILCSNARTPVAHAIGKSMWTEFKRPRFEPWLDLNFQKHVHVHVVSCLLHLPSLFFLFWVFRHAHTQLRSLYSFSTFNTFYATKKKILSSPRLHNFNVCILECGSLGTRLPVRMHWQPYTKLTRDIKGNIIRSCEHQMTCIYK